MKRLLLLSAAIFAAAALQAQTMKTIKLNQPNKERGSVIMKALSERRSVREYSDKKLSHQDLSDLMWAANGISSSDGKRTAPTARNDQDIDVYVIMQEGAYLYVPESNELTPVAEGDFRPQLADRQEFVNNVPVCLLIVSDYSRFKGLPEAMQKQFGALDAGMVSQNISLFCSGSGLVTVPRAYMQKDNIKKSLKLKDSQEPLLNHPVGYPKN